MRCYALYKIMFYLLTYINKTEINFVKKLQKEQYSTQRYTIVNICTM